MYDSTAAEAPATAPRSAGCSERSLDFSASTMALYCATVSSANRRIVAGAFVLYFMTMLRATSFHFTVETISASFFACEATGASGVTIADGSWHAAVNAIATIAARRAALREYEIMT